MKLNRLKFCILFLFLISSITLLSCVNNNTVDTKDVEIIKFTEDTTPLYNINDYRINAISINNNDVLKDKNIWVTKDFLNKNERLIKVKSYLENGCNVFVQKYKITSEEVYDLFQIPKESRAFKTTKEAELSDIKLPLERYGIMIFKYNKAYYTPGLNSITGKLDNILSIFKYNKELVK